MNQRDQNMRDMSLRDLSMAGTSQKGLNTWDTSPGELNLKEPQVEMSRMLRTSPRGSDLSQTGRHRAGIPILQLHPPPTPTASHPTLGCLSIIKHQGLTAVPKYDEIPSFLVARFCHVSCIVQIWICLQNPVEYSRCIAGHVYILPTTNIPLWKTTAEQ